jgi:hypothetical protein
MKPAARHHGTRPYQALLTAFTKGASVIALCAGLFGQATAKSLPASAMSNLHSSKNLESNGNVSKLSSTRLNQIFQDFQKPGMTLEQAALSWPPQFAIGQTWTISIVGIGMWNLPLSTTIEGDATGYTTGTDKREGYFKYFPKNGNDAEIAISYLQSDTDIYECGFFATGNPSGNTLNGMAFRYIISTKKVEDLKTTCSATLTGGSSQTTTPTSPFANPNVPLNPNANQTQPSGATPVWPPKPGEAWTMTIDGLAPWAINFEKLDKDGDPTGPATQSGVKSTAFAYLDNGEYVFEITDGKVVTDCVFTKLQVQGNAFVGGKAYSGDANSNSIPPLNKACSAALGGGQPVVQPTMQAQNLSWPPQLAVGQNWDYRLGTRPVVYHGNFASVSNNVFKGDLITDGSSDPIAKRALSVVFSTKDDALISFAEDPQGGVTGCLFIGPASLKNNTYVGSALFKVAGAKDFTDLNFNCVMNAVTAATPQASNLTPTWPPKPSENWTMTIEGLAPWAISFETLDKGDPTGPAVQSGAKFVAYAYQDKDGYEFELSDDTNVYFCTFTTLQVQGNAFVGGKAYAGPKSANSIPSLKKSCSAAIGSSAGANTNAGGSTLSGIFGSTNTSPNTNTGLGWPVQVAPGQIWSVNVKNLVFQLKLERVNNGFTIGTATSSNVELAGGFTTQGDDLSLILTDGTATIICKFGRSSVKGQTLNGQATYIEKPNAAEQSWGACSATLAPKVSGAANPLTFKPKGVLEAQISMLRHFSNW